MLRSHILSTRKEFYIRMASMGKVMKIIGGWPSSPNANTFIDIFESNLAPHGCRFLAYDPFALQCSFVKMDAIILHWPDAIFRNINSRALVVSRIIRVIASLLVAKTRGTKIIWLVHNLEPHDLKLRFRNIWSFYEVLLGALTDKWFTLSPSTRASVESKKKCLSGKPSTSIFHPTYKIENKISGSEARTKIGLSNNNKVISHIGVMRWYKNPIALIECFKQVTDADARLIIVGACKDPRLRKAIVENSISDSRIIVRLGRVDLHEYEIFLMASDLFVAPYTSALHSGSVIHALSCDTRVLAFFSEYTEDISHVVGSNDVELLHDELSVNSLWLATKNAFNTRDKPIRLSTLDDEKQYKGLYDFIFSN